MSKAGSRGASQHHAPAIACGRCSLTLGAARTSLIHSRRARSGLCRREVARSNGSVVACSGTSALTAGKPSVPLDRRLHSYEGNFWMDLGFVFLTALLPNSPAVDTAASVAAANPMVALVAPAED